MRRFKLKGKKVVVFKTKPTKKKKKKAKAVRVCAGCRAQLHSSEPNSINWERRLLAGSMQAALSKAEPNIKERC